MSDRITLADLEAVCRRINRSVNGTDQVEPWERKDGQLRANVGVYYIDGAYGGYALYRMTNKHGGVQDVLNGHRPKRELREQMFAFLAGFEQAQPRARLEELRTALREERISYGELAELQNLAAHITPDDVELREAAGLPEHDNS